jgi:Putative zinc-finger
MNEERGKTQGCEGTMTDDDLERLLSSKESLRSHRAWGCPDEATLAAFVDGTLPESARSRVQSHLADCETCLQDVAATLRARETPLPEVPARLLARAREFAKSTARGTLAPAWRWGMISAAAVLVLVAATHFWQSRPVPAPGTSPAEVRSVPGQPVAPQILSPVEGAIVGREQIELRWRGVAGAIYYEIQLVTAEGDVLWQERTEKTEARLSKALPIAPGQQVYFWVRAHLLDGKTLKSDPVGFTLDTKP